MANIEFHLPEIGEGITEAEIIKWLVAVGDTVAKNQPVVEVMTDKATVEIPSSVAGKIAKLGAKEGDVIPIHATLLELEGDAGAAKPAAAHVAGKTAAAPSKAVAATNPGTAPAGPAKSVAPPAGDPRLVSQPPPAGDHGLVLAAPATRKMARELGVELGRVAGSGAHGRVTPDDVRAASAPKAPTHRATPKDTAPPLAPVISLLGGPATREVERVPLRGLRKKIAEAMVKSKFTATHFTYVDECDVTKLVELRSSLKDEAERRGVKLTYLPFVFKALVHALKRFPMFNASLAEYDDGRPAEIVVKKYYNLGLSVATEQGLIVPVVRDVDRLSLFQVASEIQRVSADARAGKIKPADIGDQTFTVTSAGNIGGLFATPIINYPDVAIVGVHVIKKRPIVDAAGAIVARDMTYLSMSLDHRVIDGAEAAHFVNELFRYLGEPGRLLLDAI